MPFEPIEPGLFTPVDAGKPAFTDLVRVLGNTTATLAGNGATSGQALFIQAGTTVDTPDASDDITITLPVKFPGGLLTVVAVQGDATHGVGIEATHTHTTSSFKVRFGAAGIARVNWIAIGF